MLNLLPGGYFAAREKQENEGRGGYNYTHDKLFYAYPYWARVKERNRDTCMDQSELNGFDQDPCKMQDMGGDHHWAAWKIYAQVYSNIKIRLS